MSQTVYELTSHNQNLVKLHLGLILYRKILLGHDIASAMIAVVASAKSE